MAENPGTRGAEFSQPDDALVAKRAARGDTHAFGELVDRHAESLFRLAYSLAGNAADAQDLVQETFAGAFVSIRRFEGRSSVRTWLGQILVRQAASMRRSNYVRRTVPLTAAPTEDFGVPGGVEHVDKHHDVAAALQQLSAEHRTVIVLREFEQMSYDQMAATLGLPRGTVESRLHRARSELRMILGDYEP